MARVHRPLSSRKVRMRLTFDTRGLDQSLEALDALTVSPALVTQLLRQAIAETLLTAYRKRFLDSFEVLLSPERAGGKGASLQETPRTRGIKDKLLLAFADAAKADAAGDRAGRRLVQKRIERLTKSLVQHTQRPGGSSELATGQYRQLATEVMQLLSDASLVATAAAGDTVQAGIGHLPSLEAIKTPSATPKLTGHQTASQLTSLWRQLEFGTGVYSKLPGAGQGRGWWYGPHPGFGLQLLGAHGAQAVFDAATGVPYTRDALAFEQVFAGLLGRALSGR